MNIQRITDMRSVQRLRRAMRGNLPRIGMETEDENSKIMTDLHVCLLFSYMYDYILFVVNRYHRAIVSFVDTE